MGLVGRATLLPARQQQCCEGGDGGWGWGWGWGWGALKSSVPGVCLAQQTCALVHTLQQQLCMRRMCGSFALIATPERPA